MIKDSHLSDKEKIKIGEIAIQLIETCVVQEIGIIIDSIHTINQYDHEDATRILSGLSRVLPFHVRRWVKQLSDKNKDARLDAQTHLALLCAAARAGMWTVHGTTTQAIIEGLKEKKIAETN